MLDEALRARKVRRIIVYTLASIFFTLLFAGLLYGLRPMLLPLVLGGFLAYLFKPVTASFRGSIFSKYARALVLLMGVGTVLYWSAALVKASLPNEKEKLQLKIRLQYRLTERYQTWMGLTHGPKGNFIYKSVGNELDQLKSKAIEFVRLTDEERQRFIVLNEVADDNQEAQRYYEYYVANLKSQKIDIEKLKEQSKIVTATKIEKIAEGEKPGTLATIMSVFSHWIIMPLAFIFILLDKGQIVHFVIRIVPNRYFELMYMLVENVDDALGRYIRGTMIECLLVGVTLALGFYVIGIELKVAVMIGALGGLTNAIPFVGTFIACVIGATYALIAENVQPILPLVNQNNLMIAVVAVVMIAHVLDNAIFQPLVVGSAVNIHPLVVILGVFGGSLMFGFAGLIFAIPTIVVLKVVTETLFTGLKDYRII